MTLPLFWVGDSGWAENSGPISGLGSGSELLLDGSEGKHAATVRRLRLGEELLVSDGQGGLARCLVVETGKDWLRLSVAESWRESQVQPQVHLVQALIKGDRAELAVELATEAGVDAITPWQASRCVARWEPGPRTDKALARWRTRASEAAKQARRARKPEVTEPAGLPELLELVAKAEVALVLNGEADQSLADVPLPEQGRILLVVGPEGGISGEELDALTRAGATGVRLGPTVLRASTAAAVALGALGVRTARWE